MKKIINENEYINIADAIKISNTNISKNAKLFAKKVLDKQKEKQYV